MKYYAVAKGRKIGIYLTWEEAKIQVIAYSGAVYKSFTNEKDAYQFIQKVGIEEFLKDITFIKESDNNNNKMLYAVAVGWKPGIYKDWDSCKKQIEDYKNPIFRNFRTYKEAILFIKKANGIETEETNNLDKTLIAYVDGSYADKSYRNIPEYGSGIVLIDQYTQNIIKEISVAGSDTDLLPMRNVAGEINASIIAVDTAIELGYSKIIIYFDYIGIKNWVDGTWKTNKKGTTDYKNRIIQRTKKINIQFEKVKAHSGDKYNNIADNLAKSAIGL